LSRLTTSNGPHPWSHPPISANRSMITGANTAINTNIIRMIKPAIPILLPRNIVQISVPFFL
jgi:hypothetical protein